MLLSKILFKPTFLNKPLAKLSINKPLKPLYTFSPFSLYRNTRYFCNKNNNQRTEEILVEDNEVDNKSKNSKEDWYIPENKLYFDSKGYCLICEAGVTGSFRFFSILTGLFFFFFFQKSAYKLTLDFYHRGFLGFFWYCGMGFTAFWAMKKNYQFTQNMVCKIRLHKSGTKVQIETCLHPMGTLECKIAEIKRPYDISKEFMENERF